MRRTEVIEVLDDGDDDFLSMVDAAEAEALAASRSKRQRVSDSDSVPEGPYMAALRGSRSALWQQQQQQQQQKRRPGPQKGGAIPLSPEKRPSSGTPLSNPGACFKCGMDGHWARDCTAGGGGGGSEGDVPEKACPCGSGSCLVLTSNTAKNPGRKFYRCPLREETGGCNFFEWCDNPSPGISATRNVSSYTSNSSVPNLPCPCGAGSCVVLTAKTGKNVGQQFYRCPANEERGSCGFFKWCSDHISVSSQPTFTSMYNPSSQFSGERNASSCFKCGQGGHWARDCPNSSSNYSEAGTNHAASSATGTCFKCGKAGHWARECPNSSSDYSEAGTNHAASFATGTCFKCGKAGHWARDCPTPDTAAGAGSRKSSNSFSSSYNYECK